MLGGFGIKPTKRSNANVFYVADLEDAFERYLTHTQKNVPHPPHVPAVEGVEGVEGFQTCKPEAQRNTQPRFLSLFLMTLFEYFYFL